MTRYRRNCVICGKSTVPSPVGIGSQVCNSPACEIALRDHLNRKLPCCSACGRPIKRPPSSQPAIPSICSDVECQHLLGAVNAPDAVFCRICGIYLNNMMVAAPNHLCQSPFCRQCDTLVTAQANGQAYAAEREKRRRELVDIVQKHSLELQPELGLEKSLPIIVLPFLQHNLTSPSAERIREVTNGLLQLANSAMALNQDSTPPPDSPGDVAETNTQTNREMRYAKLSGMACGTCGGKCCNKGGDKGFLTIDKFCEVLRDHPSSTPEEIVADYMAKVPDKTFQDSCIFHGLNGCSLTREMRSITCNTFLCSSLHTLERCMDEHTSKFVLAATNFRIVDDPELRVYRIRIASDEAQVTLLADAADCIS